MLEFFLTGVLALQAFSHGVAFFALIRDARSDIKPALPVRSWLLPSLTTRTAAWMASPFWLLATLGFALAAISIWDTPLPGVTWQQVAAAAAIVSTLGIALFSGIWPGAPNRKLSKIDTIIALVINAAIFAVVVGEWLTGAGLGG
jgi:cation transport ATPase